MNYQYSEHALQRMRERNIPEVLVEETINQPDATKFEQGLMVCQKTHDGSSNEKFMIRVFLNHLKVPPIIVTVYRISKISKYL